MMKKLFSLISITLFGLTPLFVSAHGTGYLQFNPDSSASLKVADVDTPSQVFFAQNDFLGGVDFWVANPGAAGVATFELLNEQGTVLTSKAVTVSTIAETNNGTRLHVDFNSQLSVLADDRYSIRIISSMPSFRLYYSDRINLVSYNTPFVSEYITGIGKLGSEEQVFSFKHALYETNETSAPIISNVGWNVISSNEMRVDFNANEPVDYKIEYGPQGQGNTAGTDFLGDYQFCASGIATCRLNIAVSPNTTYNYTLTVKDSWGNQSQSTGTFSSGESQTPTPAPSGSSTPTPSPSSTPTPTASASPTPTPDADPPQISNLRVIFITDHSAKVAWTTDEAANSFVLIVREIDFSLTITSVTDSTFELEHLLNTGDVLNANTTYSARIKSSDATGHESTADINFTTLAATPQPTPSATPDLNPENTPQASPVQQNVTTSGSGSGGSVTWNPLAGDEPSDGYRVDVFDKDGNLVKTVLLPQGSGGAEITGLENGEYTVIVYANNDGVYEKVDKPVSLKVDDSFWQRLLALWPYLLIVLGLIAGLVIWKIIKGRPSQITTQVLPS